MSGHCKCGTYHEEDDDRLCSRCSEVQKVSRCGATFEIANGETVTPCHLNEGHERSHEGWCLGSRFLWTSDEKHSSEYREYMKAEGYDIAKEPT